MTTPTDGLTAFSQDLHQLIYSTADAGEDVQFHAEAFTQRMMDLLEEYGESENAVPCTYKKGSVRISGYGISEDDHDVEIFVTEFTDSVPPPSVPAATIRKMAEGADSFIEACFKGLHKNLEPATPAYDMALHLHQAKAKIAKIRVVLLTDGIAKDPGIKSHDVAGIAVSYHIWDLERIYRIESSGEKREQIVIDLAKQGGSLPVLGEERNQEYSCYLAVIPGLTIAELYDEWGSRLLERNVRAFLQSRGKVNSGIRQTILNEPGMFLIFNNGISATASEAMLEGPKGQRRVTALRDFQVVNGGQTTASLHHAWKKDKADLSQIQVHMKLTVIKSQDRIDEIVPKISQFSNTQNPVSAADFYSNDPFHVELEALSRTVWAPDPAGGKKLSRWFYERARGQYVNERVGQGTDSRQKAWSELNQSRQRFTKTDLAKYENSWQQLPHEVSRGAQKNFVHFSEMLATQKGFLPNQQYFQDLVAKAILFKETDRIVATEEFGGYKAQIATYTVAWLSFLSQQKINLRRVWENQALTDSVREDLRRLARLVNGHIRSNAGANISEWCKKPACWEQLKSQTVALSPNTVTELVTRSEHQAFEKAKQQIAARDAGEIQQVVEVPAATWLELSSWAKMTNNLTPFHRSLTFSIGKTLSRGGKPSAKQAPHALEALKQAKAKGFRPPGNK